MSCCARVAVEFFRPRRFSIRRVCICPRILLPRSDGKVTPDDSRHLTGNDYLQFWSINKALQATQPANLAGTGSPAFGTMPGISMHTELELLVRLGLTPRESLAAATSNYAEQLGWNELGLVEVGRRADLLILTADPTKDITNSRKIRSVILDGVILDQEALLKVSP